MERIEGHYALWRCCVRVEFSKGSAVTGLVAKENEWDALVRRVRVATA